VTTWPAERDTERSGAGSADPHVTRRVFTIPWLPCQTFLRPRKGA
jgi:hypothetical protein